ncbi:MAG: LysE family transporter [Saprospiraceae bacterium]
MFYLFLAGIGLSLLGSLPPGLISLSVAQTAFRRGFWPAMVLGVGASVAEFFQAWAAASFSEWFTQHPDVSRLFQWIALPIFLGLAVYLLFFAKAPKTPEDVEPLSVPRQFIKGVVISLFNLLAIPYWVLYCSWLQVSGWWEPGVQSAIAFSAGVTAGTTMALALYAWLASDMLRRSDKVAKYINLFVGLIFAFLGLKILYDLLA